jgi:phytanoyl-CoA hydroxylase
LFLFSNNKDGVLTRRFIRNPDKEEFEKGNCLMYTADEAVLEDKDFVPVPVKAGSVLLIHGLVRHRSGENKSPKSRHAYTFHVYDSGKAKYSDQNWLVKPKLIF